MTNYRTGISVLATLILTVVIGPSYVFAGPITIGFSYAVQSPTGTNFGSGFVAGIISGTPDQFGNLSAGVGKLEWYGAPGVHGTGFEASTTVSNLSFISFIPDPTQNQIALGGWGTDSQGNQHYLDLRVGPDSVSLISQVGGNGVTYAGVAKNDFRQYKTPTLTPAEIFQPPEYGSQHFDKTNPTMELRFYPKQGMSTVEAEFLLGVDHFNFIQKITYIPSDWTFLCNGTVPVSPPIIDPIIPPCTSYSIFSANAGYPEIVNYENHPDDKLPYFNETNEEWKKDEQVDTDNKSLIYFKDTPRLPPNFFRKDEKKNIVEFEQFCTELIGVKDDGSYVSWNVVGTNVCWKTNATYDGSGGIFHWYEDGDLPPVAEGGVFDPELVAPGTNGVPEINSATLIMIFIILALPLSVFRAQPDRVHRLQ